MEYIVLVGGQLQNKGAQAMVFTLVDRMKDAHPDKEVVLFASVYNQRDAVESEILGFKVIHWPLRIKMKVLGSQTFKHVGLTNHIKHLIQGMVKNKTGQNEIQYILKNTYKMVDISGYAKVPPIVKTQI
mgnify:CR=1 FL=1